MSASSFDIFEILKHLNNKNVDFYNTLTQKQTTSIQPVVLARWLSGTTNPAQIIIINEILNPYLFVLPKKTLWLLMSCCTTGHFQKYTWSKMRYGNESASKTVECISEYFKYSKRRARQVRHLISDADILLMTEELGYDASQQNAIRKELGIDQLKIKKTKSASTVKSTSDSDDGSIEPIIDF